MFFEIHAVSRWCRGIMIFKNVYYNNDYSRTSHFLKSIEDEIGQKIENILRIFAHLQILLKMLKAVKDSLIVLKFLK